MNRSKMLLGAAVLAAGSLAYGTASADPVPCAGSATDTGNQSWSYFSGLGADGCYQQDKRYYGFSITGLTGTPLNALTGQIETTTINFTDTHSVTWGFASQQPSLNFTVSYTIAVYEPGATSLRYITNITLLFDGITPGDTTLAATGNGGPYNLGAPGGPLTTATTGLPQTLAVSHTMKSNTGSIKSSTASYTENQIPEPASLALLGLGLAGLGVRRIKA